ncbi:MAG: aldehyde ferredoxin oxidoreductase family protein [Candidatus Bathyarchaeaceae archaeon]
MFGYAGRVLNVDLTHKKTKIEPISNGFCEKYIGGNGFAIRMLYDKTKPKVDPLGHDNALIFAVGPFAGTPVPTSGKHIVQAKSPLTNFMGESISSGSWGPTLKRAGYDAVIIKGRSEKPTYLFVDDDTIQFRDAKNLWEKDTVETDELIKEEIGDENIRSSTIGPAGERLVKFANIMNDRYRQAGRTGMGAVMGSKNLKAIAVRGTKKIEVHNLDKLMEECRDIYKQCQGLNAEFYRVWGTAGMVSVMNDIAALPTRNWQQATFELANNIGAEYLKGHYWVKTISCAYCPIGCDHISMIKDGPYGGTVASVEYETIYSLGSQCGIGYYPAIVKATDLCDRLGIDTISTGVTIGWAMECYEKGILSKDDTGGIELTFGNHEALIEMVKKIAYREGIGDLLAGGVRAASQKVGKGSERFAMHNKGLEYPGYDLRGLKACVLGFNTSTRGGCHLRSSMYDFDVKGKVNRFKADRDFGRMTKEREDLWAIVDSLIICKFLRGVCSNYDKFAELYTLVTGIKMTANKLQMAGERIYNLEKAYNIREGWTKKDDYPSPRIMNDPIPSGVAKGSFVSKKEFETMLSAYYDFRGWTSDGIPTQKKLIELGLNRVAKDIGTS